MLATGLVDIDLRVRFEMSSHMFDFGDGSWSRY